MKVRSRSLLRCCNWLIGVGAAAIFASCSDSRDTNSGADAAADGSATQDGAGVDGSISDAAGPDASDASSDAAGPDAADADAGCAPGHVTTQLWSGTAGDVAVDSTRVYWIGGGAVWAMALLGAANSGVMVASGTSPRKLFVDGSYVYFTSGMSVMRVPGDGSAAPSTVAQGTMDAQDLYVDGATVYWIEQTGATSQILAAPKGGGTATTLVTDAGSGADLPNGGNLVYYNGTLYWLDAQSFPAAAVLSVPASGGTAVPLVSGRNRGYDLHVDATGLYWTDNDGAFRAPLAGITTRARQPRSHRKARRARSSSTRRISTSSLRRQSCDAFQRPGSPTAARRRPGRVRTPKPGAT